MSLQIFVSELLFDFFVYFIFTLTIVAIIEKFIKPIAVGKYFKFGLYGIATFILLLYGLVFSNPDNIFEIKKDFHAAACKWIENERKKRDEIKEFGYAKTEVEKTYPSLF